jgi:hypothetical protein
MDNRGWARDDFSNNLLLDARNITLEDQLLGVYVPWEPGDQVPKITM